MEAYSLMKLFEKERYEKVINGEDNLDIYQNIIIHSNYLEVIYKAYQIMDMLYNDNKDNIDKLYIARATGKIVYVVAKSLEIKIYCCLEEVSSIVELDDQQISYFKKIEIIINEILKETNKWL